MMLFISIFMSYAFAYDLVGEARDHKTNQLVYVEKHRIQKNSQGLNQFIQTDYFSPDGQPIAKMKSDFAKHPLLPEIEFEDLRFQETHRQTVDLKENIIILLKNYAKQNRQKQEVINIQNSLVSGQGFDNFVKMNFNKEPETKLPFNFVVLDRLDFFRFQFEAVQKNENSKVFRLKSSSFFLRALGIEIEVEYDKTSKSLTKYKGLSNLVNSEQNTQNVLINYAQN